MEAEEIRALGLRRPIAVIANGLDLEREFASERLGELAGSDAACFGPGRRVVFLSRVHPKKGLALMLQAWRMLGDLRTAHRLVIAGPGEPAHVASLERELGAFGDGVEYLGPVHGDNRLRLLVGSDLLLLPSHSENYGMVVAEALACARPVITTTGTPWSSLVSEECGWWVRPRPVALAGALREALTVPLERLREMGARGRRLVEREHSVRITALRMEAVYEWVCGSRPRPDWAI
jgi:glycosyltransferase involved in cell wall biosynthesis